MWNKIDKNKSAKSMVKKESSESVDMLRKVEVAKRLSKSNGLLKESESRSFIGKGLVVKGELKGDSDVLIQGRVDGSIDLKNNSVIVGELANIKATIFAENIKIEGSVTGDIEASERILLTEKGKVVGNLTAKRVVLNDGCLLTGNVSMKRALDSETDNPIDAHSGRKKNADMDKGSGVNQSNH